MKEYENGEIVFDNINGLLVFEYDVNGKDSFKGYLWRDFGNGNIFYKRQKGINWLMGD